MASHPCRKMTRNKFSSPSKTIWPERATVSDRCLLQRQFRVLGCPENDRSPRSLRENRSLLSVIHAHAENSHLRRASHWCTFDGPCQQGCSLTHDQFCGESARGKNLITGELFTRRTRRWNSDWFRLPIENVGFGCYSPQSVLRICSRSSTVSANVCSKTNRGQLWRSLPSYVNSLMSSPFPRQYLLGVLHWNAA